MFFQRKSEARERLPDEYRNGTHRSGSKERSATVEQLKRKLGKGKFLSLNLIHHPYGPA